MAFVIRPANGDDLPEMLHLWREMMDFHAQRDDRFRPKPSPDAEEAWASFLHEKVWPSDRWCVLVAEEESGLVGHILGELRESVPIWEPETYGFVTDIVVDRDARRHGIGRDLFKALSAWFQERGATHLRLQVLQSNMGAQAFWRAMGCRDYADTLWYDLEP